MSVNLHQFLLTKNDCYKAGKRIKPKGIMVHSTGANNPNVARYVPIGSYNNHWNKSGIQKCVHAFIGYLPDGSIGTYQTLPFDMKGWHSGPPWKTGLIGANNTHIGFECCEDDLTDEIYFRKVINEAQELCVYLCEKFNLDPLKDGVIISHHEGHLRGIASNHGDIDHWLKVYGMTMDNFRQGVANKMQGEDEEMNDAIFAEYMKRYLDGLELLPPSEWSSKEKSKRSNEINELIKSITDESRPQALITREEVIALLSRLATILKGE